jgi:plastocyanin
MIAFSTATDETPRHPYRTLARTALLAVAVAACSGSAGNPLPTASTAAAATVEAAGPSPAATTPPVTATPAAPAMTATPIPSAAPTDSPVPIPTWPVADLQIKSDDTEYFPKALTSAAGKAFTIAFLNLDLYKPHNIHIFNPDGSDAYNGAVFGGVKVRVYDVPALTAGTYKFTCDWHDSMTGTLTVT